MEREPVLILGAGLTGLTVAATLKQHGVPVVILESASQPGGAVGTEHDEGYLVERGPNSLMLDSPEVEAFLHGVGLGGEMTGPQAHRRYLVRGGRPHALPSGPLAAVTTPIFSLPGKLRLLAEWFVPRGHDEEETLGDFVRRRLGSEVLNYAVEPFVGGIYAGDPDKLSARNAFPKLWKLEREHGSFLRGALRLRRTGPPQRMVSFLGGMGILPARLAALLAEDLSCDAKVKAITRAPHGWSVRWTTRDETHETAARALVCAVPAFAVPRLPWPEDFRAPLHALDSIEYPPVSIVALGFSRDAIRHPLDGFGMLVPAIEHRWILGSIFSSSLFPGRAPEGKVLLTTFTGGARQPRMASLGDDALVEDVCSDLRDLLGVESAPVFRRIIRWPRAIPQYASGHGAILEGLEKLESAHHGLHFVGNYRGGIAAGRCILNGLRLAEKLVSTRSS